MKQVLLLLRHTNKASNVSLYYQIRLIVTLQSALHKTTLQSTSLFVILENQRFLETCETGNTSIFMPIAH